MTILQWFDIENMAHLKAYRSLCATGVWPLGFIPKGVEMTPQWQVGLAGKMASKYIQDKLGGLGD